MTADHDTDAVLEWIADGQPAAETPARGPLEAAQHRGLIVPGRGAGFELTQDGEFEAQAFL